MTMGGFSWVMKRLGPSKNPIIAHPIPIVDPVCAEAPQVNLPHVDTLLNMHQHTGLEEAVTDAQTHNGTFSPQTLPRSNLTFSR